MRSATSRAPGWRSSGDSVERFDPNEPRDPQGRWTDDGGADGGGKHPGEGYSKDAYVDSKGVIHTSDVYDAQRALFEDRKVELSQPKQISTLIHLLGETARRYAEQGESAPVFNLCNVSVTGTNLFCAETKGIPRVEMPVIPAKQTKDFIKYLKSQGYKVEKGSERAANLRATQSEISGAKVAASMARIEKEGFYKRLVISRDDYILDGHHTWAGALGVDAKDNKLNDDKSVKIARVDISITKLLEEAEKWTGGKGKKPATEKPKQYRQITMAQAAKELPPLLFRKYYVRAQEFFALNPHLARDINDIVVVVRWDETQHPREPAGSPEGGQFTSGGGGAGAAEKPDAEKPEPKLDPKVIEVGGDEWNQATARRLEREYQEARPKIEKTANDAVGKSTTVAEDVGEPDEEEEPFIPEEWDMLSGSGQEQAEQAYYDQNLQSYLDSEQQNYFDESAPDDARQQVTQTFNEDKESEDNQWAMDALNDMEQRLPFGNHELLDAITIDMPEGYGSGSYWKKHFDIEFDDEKLNEAGKAHHEGEGEQFPGFEPPDYSKLLTEDMRKDIKNALLEAFESRVDDVVTHMEAPDYLADSAKEFMEESWSELDDEQKFEWTKQNTSIVDDESTGVDKAPSNYEPAAGTYTGTIEALPTKFDPLNEGSGTQYRRTQALAKYLSVERAFQIMQERHVLAESASPEIQARWEKNYKEQIARVDSSLWSSWKSASTTQNGILLQVATADELGGRLNTKTGAGGSEVTISPTAARNWADEHYANIGGYAGVKAYVRAKWETTQFLLDRAGNQELELYRGIDLKKYDAARYQQAVKEKRIKQMVSGFEKAPTIKIDRNGAASATTDIDVANGWRAGVDGSVVLRALIPRTAAISVPAYGINVHSEREVVIAGTAWKAWDAWLKKAPRFSDVAIGANGVGIGDSAPKLAA